MDALQHLAPVSEGYATLPVADAFNWQTRRRARRRRVVSRRLPFDPPARRGRGAADAFDELAHREAAASPGFVHYFKGPRRRRLCLSFCLWNSRADARAAAGRRITSSAVSLIDEMYAPYTLEFHRVTRAAGGALAFEAYDAGARPCAPAHPAPALHPVSVGPAAALNLAIRPAAAG